MNRHRYTADVRTDVPGIGYDEFSVKAREALVSQHPRSAAFNVNQPGTISLFTY
ncbi:hypothetical protein Q9R34_16960 [Enterobacter sp. BRE11]|nr:hypothetical protein [Enterobacter sp. BRE11]